MFNLCSPAVGIGAIVLAVMLWLVNKFSGAPTNYSSQRSVTSRPIAPSVSPERERELLTMVCPEICAILEDELRAGNRIVSGGKSSGTSPDSVVISLGFIFKAEPKALPLPLRSAPYDYKIAMGDSIYCPEHRVTLFSVMPTLEQHLEDSLIIGDRREERLKELSN